MLSAFPTGMSCFSKMKRELPATIFATTGLIGFLAFFSV